VCRKCKSKYWKGKRQRTAAYRENLGGRGNSRLAMELAKNRPFDIEEGYWYLVAKYKFGESVEQIAAGHNRYVSHIETCLPILEKLCPKWVQQAQEKGRRRSARKEA